METPCRVLVAEDCDSMRQLLVQLLQACGFSDVREACDGREALRMLFAGDTEYDVVFVDWHMPHVEGIEVVRAARGAGYQIPMVMVTGEAGADGVREAIHAGVDDYVVKPLRKETFVKKVARLQRQLALSKLGAAFRVKHAMTRDVVCVQAEMPVRDAAELLVERRVSGLPVIDSLNCLVGIITEYALVERLCSPSVDGITVGDVMSTGVLVLNEDSLVTEAVKLVIERKLRCVPVVRGRELVGIIARRDLIRFLLEHRDRLARIIEMSRLDRLESCQATVRPPLGAAGVGAAQIGVLADTKA